MARLGRFLGVAALGATALVGSVAPSGSVWAAPVAVDATISETLPATTGSLTAGSIPGCATPVVTTTSGATSSFGATTVFRGEKSFDCGGGDGFTLRFVAAVTGCAANDGGLWRVTGGTGTFAGVRGRGVLVGSYTLGGVPADACSADGIDDRYLGVLRL